MSANNPGQLTIFIHCMSAINLWKIKSLRLPSQQIQTSPERMCGKYKSIWMKNSCLFLLVWEKSIYMKQNVRIMTIILKESK